MIDILFATLISFIISAVATALLIPFLRKLKFGQEVRDDGPKTHLKKQGTPTMGGVAFVFAILVTGVIFSFKYPEIWPIIIMTVGYAIIGFIDDYLKVVRHNTKGLHAWQKLVMQFALMIGLCIYMMFFNKFGTTTHIPFTDITVDLGWFYPIFVFLVVLGTDNGVNFTDGVDGLCSFVTIIVAVFISIAALKLGVAITPISSAVIGALFGFLIFNAHPAKVFMGDTGSLALGGFVATSFLMINNPLLILLVGFIYFAEILSSIIQVAYFKKTHGKRIFKMAPIHHHFELCGWSEWKVVIVFSAVTLVLSVIAYFGL